MNKNKKHRPLPAATTAPEVEDYISNEDIYANNERVLLGDLQSDDDQNDHRGDNIPIGQDLDVPGAELDDAHESLGAEDEENNYYSLGGDSHDDLEENNS